MDERSILGGVGRLMLQTFPDLSKCRFNLGRTLLAPPVTALSEGNATSIQDMAECGFAAAQWGGRVCGQLARSAKIVWSWQSVGNHSQ